jgi:hypothetical protein
VCSRTTAPRWTNEMATPQTDTHAREQTRRDEQAPKNAEAARAGVEKLADFRQRATDNGWQSIKSGLDATSQSLQNASDQFTRTLGFSAEDGERLALQSAQNVAAITNLGTVLTQACPAILILGLEGGGGGVWPIFGGLKGPGQGGRGGGLRRARVSRSSVQEENTR